MMTFSLIVDAHFKGGGGTFFSEVGTDLPRSGWGKQQGEQKMGQQGTHKPGIDTLFTLNRAH